VVLVRLWWCVFVWVGVGWGGVLQMGFAHVNVDIFVRIFLFRRCAFYPLRLSNQSSHSPIFASLDSNTLAYIRALYDTLCTHRLILFLPCTLYIHRKSRISHSEESYKSPLWHPTNTHTDTISTWHPTYTQKIKELESKSPAWHPTNAHTDLFLHKPYINTEN